MNLFLLGWSPSEPIDLGNAERVLSRYVEQLPFFGNGGIRTWRAPSARVVALWASHSPSRTGGVGYVHHERDRFALYSGRPFVWTGQADADGRAPLDPRYFLEPTGSWSAALDGRCVVARYDDSTSALELYTDPLGSYHVFETRQGETTWLSNSSELLATLAGARQRDPLVLASLVVCGWSLGGQPLWRAVRRLRRGAVHRLGPDISAHRELLPAARIGSFFESTFDAGAAASVLVAVVRALVDWPGRPSFVPVTGGRDSRLVFAAALSAGVQFEPLIGVGSTSSGPESPDVLTARALCDHGGRSLVVGPSRTVATVEDAARILRLIAPGTDSLERAWPAFNRPVGSGLPDRQDVPLALVHSGHAGEVARAYYGVSERPEPARLVRQLYRGIAHAWPKPPVTREGKWLVERYLTDWVDEHVEAGISAAHVPDVFYLLERMGNWAGAAHGVDEYMEDVTSPLWTHRLLPYEWGLPAGERTRELFHFHVLNALAPEFTRVPFAGSNPPWPTFGRTRDRRRSRRLLTIAFRARRELDRRYEYYVRRRREADDAGLADAVALALERVPADAGHEVWGVLDRRRAVSLLRRDPLSLDPRSRRIVWRLATAFAVCVE